jgi:hypothetical protein
MRKNGLLIIVILNLLSGYLQAQISVLADGHENCCGTVNPNGFGVAGINGNGSPPFQYQWSTGAIHSSYDYTDTLWGIAGGNYTVTVTDDNGATGSGSFQMPNLPSLDFAPVAVALPKPGTSTGIIQASTFGNAVPGPLSMLLYNTTTSQTWGPVSFACGQSGVQGPCWGIHTNFDHLPAGNYTCQLSNSNGCSGTFSIQLPALATPVYSLALSPGPACSGAANGILTMHFSWQNNIPGNVNYSNSAFGPNQTQVKESLQYYLYTNAGLLTGIKYNLNDSEFTGLQAGNYKLHVVYLFDYPANPVEISRDTFPVTIVSTPNPAPAITANGSVTFCSGGSVLLSTPNSAGGIFQWKKNGTAINGATSNTYTATSTGTFKVQKTNQYGCIGTSAGTAVTVLILPAATAAPQGPTTFCAGDSVLLKANYNSSYSYQWKKNNANIANAITHKYYAKTAGSYKIKVTNSNGCTQISSAVNVSVPCRKESQDISNMDVSVTPNPSNDFFNLSVKPAGGEKITVTVYDITGREIKEVIQQVSPSEFIITGLLNGIYVAEIKQGSQRKIVRVVKTNN